MSSRRFITQGEGLPQWSMPIGHAVVAGNTCYVSGQVSVDVSGQYVLGSAREEAKHSFANFFAAVKAAGFSNDDIVFVDIAFIFLATAQFKAVIQLHLLVRVALESCLSICFEQLTKPHNAISEADNCFIKVF